MEGAQKVLVEESSRQAGDVKRAPVETPAETPAGLELRMDSGKIVSHQSIQIISMLTKFDSHVPWIQDCHQNECIVLLKCMMP